MKDPYVYEDTGTLKNKLGIKDYEELRKAESDISFVKLLTVWVEILLDIHIRKKLSQKQKNV